MADFFSRLLDKACARTEVLQWRRPSRFEPRPGTPASGEGLAEERARTDLSGFEESRARFNLDPRTPVTPVVSEDGGTGTVSATTPAARNEAIEDRATFPTPRYERPKEVRPAFAPVPAPAALTPGPAGEGVPAAQFKPEQPAPVHPEAPRTEIGEKRLVTAGLPGRPQVQSGGLEPVLRAVGPMAQHPPPATRTIPSAAPPQAHEPENRFTSRARKKTADVQQSCRPEPARKPPPPSLTLHDFGRRNRTDARNSGPVQKIPVPPPVQITIGRIEIRASQNGPAVPARPANPGQPRLSLEEYLRLRSGGDK